MVASQWIQKAQGKGWRVQSASKGVLSLRCSAHGCKGALSLPLSNLGQVPEPCALEHVAQYAKPVFDEYRALVSDLARRRRLLGLSQEDLNAAAGLADGHINKLEAFARTAQFPTLQLWAKTLGTSITLAPSPLPAATTRAIEQRPAPLIEKPTQKALFP